MFHVPEQKGKGLVQKSQHNKRFQIGAIFAVVTLAFCTAMAVSASTYAVADVDAASTPAPELENDLLLMPETNEVSMLESTTEVDISATVEAIGQKKEAERIAAEKKREAARKAAEAKRLAEQKKHQERAQANIATWKNLVAGDRGASALAGLSPVDWSVSKEQFVTTWTNRINSYLSGTELAGYGETFAQAAWEYGIDPRWSPAISNTESTNGAHCFLPHNAWGWGQSSWATWDQAIWAHVAGLAAHYGYSITYSFAYKYCPPNYNNWFYNTLGQMKRI